MCSGKDGKLIVEYCTVQPLLLLRTNRTKNTLCTAITDEGSRRLLKRRKFVTILASMYEPQSCQNYLATQDCSNVSEKTTA